MAITLALGVTPEMMKSKAAEVMVDIELIRENVYGMAEEMHETSSYWKGDAGDLQRQEFETRLDEFNQLYARLKTYPERILQIAGLYEEGTHEATNVAASTKTDIMMS